MGDMAELAREEEEHQRDVEYLSAVEWFQEHNRPVPEELLSDYLFSDKPFVADAYGPER